MLYLTSADLGIFFVGVIVGLFVGIVVNLFVTSHLRKTDGEFSKNTTNLYFVSLIVLMVLTLLTAVSFFYLAQYAA